MTGLNPMPQTECNMYAYMQDGIYSDVLIKINFGVPQGSVLGPLHLHNSIRFSFPFHFANDTGLLNIHNNICATNKTLNNDLKELSFWLNAKKIALSIAKTEIILFKTRNKNYADIKIKLCRKRIQASLYVKYINENLNSKTHMNKFSTKLIKGNVMLSKLWQFVNKDILLSVYYAIFYSHLAYLCLVWGKAKFSFLNHFTMKESHQNFFFFFLSNNFHVLQTSATNKIKMKIQYKI